MNSTKKYKILKVIGRGSQGVCYKCEKIVPPENQNEKRKYFAMKRIMVSTIDEANEAIKEMNRVIQLPKNDGVANYLEIMLDQAEGMILVSIVMELYDIDLEKYLEENYRNNTPLSDTEIIDIFTQLCLTIEFLHSNNIIHRDIKPSNIYMKKRENTTLNSEKTGNNQKIVIGDFGLAANYTSSSFKSSVLGSPYWISPEIMNGEGEYSFKVDIFSLGATLYNLATGKNKMFYLELMKSEFSLKTEIQSDLKSRPKWIKELIFQMIEKDPKLRPSAKEVNLFMKRMVNISPKKKQIIRKRKRIDFIAELKLKNEKFSKSLRISFGVEDKNNILISENSLQNIFLFCDPLEILLSHNHVQKSFYEIIHSQTFLDLLFDTNIRKINFNTKKDTVSIFNQQPKMIDLNHGQKKNVWSSIPSRGLKFHPEKKSMCIFFQRFLDRNMELKKGKYMENTNNNIHNSKIFILVTIKNYRAIHQFFRFKFRRFHKNLKRITEEDCKKFSPFHIQRENGDKESLMHYIARFNLIDLLEIIRNNTNHIYLYLAKLNFLRTNLIQKLTSEIIHKNLKYNNNNNNKQKEEENQFQKEKEEGEDEKLDQKMEKVISVNKFDCFQFGRVVDRDQNYALFVACYHGNIEIVRIMLNMGGITNLMFIKNISFGQTIFHLASTLGNLEMIRFLFEESKMAGIENKVINVLDGDGFTPLHLAARKNNFQVCKQLIVFGAKKDLKATLHNVYPYEMASNGSVISLLML